jgi:hypothetical protein
MSFGTVIWTYVTCTVVENYEITHCIKSGNSGLYSNIVDQNCMANIPTVREIEGTNVTQLACMHTTPPVLPAHTRVRSKGQQWTKMEKN